MDSSPRHFIDLTVLNTPRPQAASTVERKSIHRNRNNHFSNSDSNNYQTYNNTNTNNLEMDIPTRDTDDQSVKSNTSRFSAASSLGILSLDNVEDIQEYLTTNQITDDVNKASQNINAQLGMQRLLAQKAMERIDSKTKTTKTKVGGLPSYLLQPTLTPDRSNAMSIVTPNKNESTVNLSDLERSMPKMNNSTSQNISFEAEEISARSSSFGNHTKNDQLVVLGTIDLRTPSPVRGLSTEFSARCQSICERIRQSDMSLAALCNRSSKLGVYTEPLEPLSLTDVNAIDISSDSSCASWNPEIQDSLISKLQNELFTPAELATTRLLEDEMSWRKAKDVMPIKAYNNNKENLEVSSFSGYMDGDMSLKSKANEDVSIGEFFRQRSDNVQDLNLKCSPEKTHPPVPLINDTFSTYKSDVNDISKKEKSVRFSELPRMSTEYSILSATRIADALSKMDINETPSRVVDMLMKKVPLKPPRTSLNQPTQITQKSDSNYQTSTSTFKKSHTTQVTETADTSTKSNLDTLKENSQDSSSVKHRVDKQHTENILRDSTNMPDVISKNKNVTVIDLTSDGEWTDAKPNVAFTVDNNGTISSITDSPSYSCSELEFSEDEKPDALDDQRQTDIETDDWIHIEQQDQIIKAYAYVTQNITLLLKSKSNHWIHLKLSVKKITSNSYNDKLAEIQLINEQCVLKSFANEQLNFKVICLVLGKINVIMKIKMIDMVTKAEKNLEHTINIEVEKPKITISSELLDFKIQPEAAIKREVVTIKNQSSVDLKLALEIFQDYEWVFMFASDDSESDSKTDKAEIKRIIHLPINGQIQVPIEMCAPKLDELGISAADLASLKGTLRISLTDQIVKCLNKVKLFGKVGLTKVQFKTSCMPFVLLPGQTKALQVRNSGIITLELSVNVCDSEQTNISNDFFIVDTNNIELKPGQIGTIHITFNMKEKCIGPVQSSVRLEYPRGPSFVLPIEGITDGKSQEIKKSSPSVGSPKLRSPKLRSPNIRSPNIRSPKLRSPILSRSPRIDRNSGARSGSSQSCDSGSTLSYLQDGKLPIESTKTELVWGCVKPTKNSCQEFVLRNRCSQRVRLQAVIKGSGCFKFVKDHTESATSMTLVLHSLESRTISVNFCPTGKGATKAHLIFLPIDQEVANTKRQMIQLYGYGGHCSVDIQKVAKDTSGRMWLSFGRLDYRETLNQIFIVRNTGSLAAFACLSVCCKVLYPFMDSSVKISPTEIVIEPNKEVEVSVSFTPRPEDFKYIQKTNATEVSEIASIKILTGPEPTRGRIRRLFNKINSGNQTGSNSIMTQLSSNFLVPRLSNTFPGEHIPADVSAICRESSSALRDLLRDIDTRDLVLTIEKDLDTECTGLDNPVDETCMFQSLVCGNGTVNDTTLTTTGRVSGGFCTVEPRKVTITPPLEPHATVLIKSHHSRPMPYEVCIPQQTMDAGIQVSPQVGVLAAGEIALLTVTTSRVFSRSPYTCMFMIYVENEVMEIEVKLLNAQVRRS